MCVRVCVCKCVRVCVYLIFHISWLALPELFSIAVLTVGGLPNPLMLLATLSPPPHYPKWKPQASSPLNTVGQTTEGPEQVARIRASVPEI